jgi:hypothetical protein
MLKLCGMCFSAVKAFFDAHNTHLKNAVMKGGSEKSRILALLSLTMIVYLLQITSLLLHWKEFTNHIEPEDLVQVGTMSMLQMKQTITERN